MRSFLENYYSNLKNKTTWNKNYLYYTKERDIFFDFYVFLLYFDYFSKQEEMMRIEKEIETLNFFDEFTPIDKHLNLLSNLEKKFNNIENKNIHCFIYNFYDFPELLEIIDSRGLFEMNKLKEVYKKLKEEYKIKDTTKSLECEVIYLNKKEKNNYERLKNALLDFLEKRPLLDKENLQVLRYAIKAIESLKIEIKPFRKKLKACILDPKIRHSQQVYKYLRPLITKGIFHEKGISKEFNRLKELERLILNICIEIYKNSSKPRTREEFNDFFYEFFKKMCNIYGNTSIFLFYRENFYNHLITR